ncbi:MAG: hypothetical protein ACR2IK_25410 [Chloroflexota bacterium]
MSELSEYLIAHIPDGWSKAKVVEVLEGKVDRTTVYRYLAGQHPRRPAEATLEGFAAGLPGVSLTELHRLAGGPIGEDEPWVPTKEANRLNRGQRLALDAFIRATVAAQDETGTVEVIEELLAERRANNQELAPKTQTELEQYVKRLQASGRGALADRLTASLVINSASHTANRSASE